MRIKLFPTLKDYRLSWLGRDVFAGLIIAAVSIPIAMGYAQIAGLPAVCGLYGSVFPILLFAAFSTSRQFIFGVDAAPAAIVGGALATLGVEAGSPEALQYVPMMALATGLWLLLFYLLRADRMVDFISTPVMGGFISGIALTIILMQAPKLLGAGAGTGELPELLRHLAGACRSVSWLSLSMGLFALILLRAAGKWFPRFPMAIVIMAAGVVSTLVFRVQERGVVLLEAVTPGLPPLFLPDFSAVDLTQVAGRGLMVAVVVMAETLLAENNFASANGYRLDDRQEILACAAGNLAAGAVGCCPVNGSISRTSMNGQYGGRSQAVSLTAGIAMAAVLLFATGFIGYLPVPVLTAIVISALMNVVEAKLAFRLFRVSKNEFLIFLAACVSVLFLGTIYGVVIGIILSFAAVILKATNPPRSFRGMIPGREAYYDLGKNRYACPIRNVVIYRFCENLFFANVKIFQNDIEGSVREDTKAVIVDASAVNSIDITAADCLERLAESLKRRGIRFYITEHADTVNAQMRALGIGHLIEEGAVRRTILAALKDAGIPQPCPLEVPEGMENSLETARFLPAEEENTLEEFAWAFGAEAVREIEKTVRHIMAGIHGIGDVEELAQKGLRQRLEYWHSLGAVDEDELLRRIELHLDELPGNMASNRAMVLELIEGRRRRLREQLRRESWQELRHLEQSREKLERRLEKQDPEAVRKWREWQREGNAGL